MAPDISELFLEALPGKNAVIIALFMVFLGTQNGRLLLADGFIQFVRATVFLLPQSVRYRLIAAGLSLPHRISKKLLYSVSRPFGSQLSYIRRIQNEVCVGDWIGLDIPNRKTAWIEQTAADIDLVILYLHGGGFRFGFSTQYSEFCMNMLKILKEKHNLKARIFSVDYRLAPETTWPGPLDDCLLGYRYLVHQLSISPSRLIIAGDSAGGNLAASVLLKIRNQRNEAAADLATLPPLPMPAGCMLVSPWTLLRADLTVYPATCYTDFVQRDQLKDHLRYYLPQLSSMSEDERDAFLRRPDVSPFYADNFTGFCPTLVTVGDGELLSNDIHALIKRMQNDRVPVTVIRGKGAPHIWIVEPAVCTSKASWLEDVAKVASWCSETLKNSIYS